MREIGCDAFEHYASIYSVNFEAEYFYQTQPRLQLFFDSPNHCATILGMTIIMFCGLWSSLSNWRWSALFHKFKWTLYLTWASVLLMGLIGLILTYSRGGWVAFIIGLCVLISTSDKNRQPALIILILFVLVILLIPQGPQRALSVVDADDRSIGNRILVWKGALAMTADHPLTGVGTDMFGRCFSSWYQPLEMRTTYLAALNNYLTLSAEKGIAWLWIYLCIVFLPFMLYIVRARKCGSKELFVSALSAQIVFLISGLFTYNLSIWHVSGIYWILYVISLLSFYWFLISGKIERIQISMFLVGMVIPSIVSLLVLVSGVYYQQKLPSKTEFFDIRTGFGPEKACISIPRNQRSLGVLIYYHDKGSNFLDESRYPIRYLAERGFTVIAVNYREGGYDGLSDVRFINNWSSKRFKNTPVYLMGYGLGARLAILSASYDSNSQIKGIVSIGSDAEWPFSAISPKEHISKLSCPILIIHSKQDRKVSVEQAYILKKLCNEYNKSSQLIVCECEFDGTDENTYIWNDILKFVKGSS